MISLLFPVYNEEDNLKVLYERTDAVARGIPDHKFEYVFIDDCSSDSTADVLSDLRGSDPRIKVIRFARNCGSHAAIAAGMNYAKGDCAIVLAADLQDPPEIIENLIAEWRKGAKIVWGARKKRSGANSGSGLFSRLYYLLINWLTSVKVPPLGADVFLADRTAIEAFKKVREKHTSVFMVLAWLGFHQETIYYTKEPRYAGRSKWSLGRKIKLTLDSLLAFSDIFIRYLSVIGCLTALAGFTYAGYVFWSFVHGTPVDGWSSLMVVILVMGGIQMIMLGILGEYLWRTFDESRQRPRYVIDYTTDDVEVQQKELV